MCGLRGLVLASVSNARSENGSNRQETSWAVGPTSSRSQAAIIAGSSFPTYRRRLRLVDGSQACRTAMPVDHKFGLVRAIWNPFLVSWRSFCCPHALDISLGLPLVHILSGRRCRYHDCRARQSPGGRALCQAICTIEAPLRWSRGR